MKPASVYLMLLALALLAGCRGGGGITPEDEAEASGIYAVQTSGELRAYGSHGAADPGTTAYVVNPYTGEAVVAADGSFTITIELPVAGTQTAAAKTQVSQLFMAIRLSYVRDGVDRLATATVTHLADYMTKPLFSTGAGPNDMVFGLDSLYVANTFDNTVVRYGLDGSEIASISYEEGASPSFVGVGEGYLTVSTNGTNRVRSYDPETCEPCSPSFEYSPNNVAFLGFGQPILGNNFLYVATAMITSFNPTVYGEPVCNRHVLEGGSSFGFYHFDYARNMQYGAFDDERNWFLLVATGEIQFDENWMPYVTSDSFLIPIWQYHEWGVPHGVVRELPEYEQLNLGAIGAGRITVDDNTGIAYLGNALNGNLYKVDYVNGTVLRGISNPIVLTEEFTYISDVAFTPDGRYVLATSFNTDELYVIDTATDTVSPGPYPAPLDMSLDPELMAGCANVEVDPTPRADGGFNAYVLYGIANAVAKVELIP